MDPPADSLPGRGGEARTLHSQSDTSEPRGGLTRPLRSLRGRLLAMLSGALIVVFAAIIGLYGFLLTHERRQAETYTLEAARGLAAEYQHMIEGPRTLLYNLSLLSTGSHAGDPCRLPLAKLVQEQPQLLDLLLLDGTGRARCTARQVASVEALATDPALHLALQGKGGGAAAVMGDYGRPALMLTRSISAADGAWLAVALIDLDWANRHFANLVPGGSVLRILDRDGRFLVRQPDPTCCVGQSGLHLPGIGTALAYGRAQTLESVWHDHVMRVQSDWPLPAEIGGVLSVGVASAALHAPAERTLAAGTLLLIALTGVMFVLAWRGAESQVLDPLRALSAAADRLREGAAAPPLSPGGAEEFRRLAAGFNGMAAAIEDQRSSLRLAASVFEHAQEAITITNAGGEIIAVNPRFSEITGYAETEAIGSNPRLLKSDRHPPEFYRSMWEDLTEHGTWRGEIWNRRKDGTVYPEWLSISTVRDDDGKTTHYVAVFTDLTALKSAEAELRRSEARLRSLIEVIPEAIILKDGDNRWQVVNRAARQLYEIDGVAWQGRTDIDLASASEVHYGEHLAAWQRDEDAWRQGRPLSATEVFGARSEKIRVLEVTRVPLIDGGLRQALVVVGRDITEQHRNAETLQRMNESLEARVADRTRELEASVRDLESFSYSVSHDLRAPLRAINGFTQLLESEHAGALDGQARDYLRRVRTASLRMGELIDDLLELSRVARQPLQRRRANLTALSDEVVAELRADEPGRRIDCSIAPNMEDFCDPGLIRIVLHNLIGNAWKYTARRDQAQIAVGMEAIDGHPVYFVSDNGAGFDMRYADKLFAPFQRLHSSNEYAGTGIGLATVARIVQRHGGRVWGESQTDQGATFRFTLQAG